MTLLKLTIPKQQNEENPIATLEVEDDAIVITAIASFYKVGQVSNWVLSPQGLTFTRSGDSFSSVKLRKDNTTARLTLEVKYATAEAKEVAGSLNVDEMNFVSELPHDVRIKLNQ